MLYQAIGPVERDNLPPAVSAAWIQDLAKAALAALLVLVVQASGGFTGLANLQGDNDSLLRLVQIRDLIAGQGWFDPQQYRMGPQGGFPMHWSRLVDAPVAAIILVAGWVTGGAGMGETVALVAWPLMTYAAGLFFLLCSARRFAGDEAAFPALVIGGIGIYMLGIFLPAALDHHNLQLALTMAMISGLLASPDRPYAACLAGACAALMMAVGAETLPYVAAGCLGAALLYLVSGERERATAIGFGLSFAVVSALAFVVTVPRSGWFIAACDAYSVAQFSVAVLGGAGLVLAASSRSVSSGLPRRFAALALIAVCAGGLLLTAFPQCLADPYAGLDPRLKTYWLDGVSEAQSLFSILSNDPVLAASYYATPLLAAGLLILDIKRNGWTRARALVMLFLGSAILVSLWQVRGAIFSISIAVIVLAAWVASWRVRTQPGSRAAGPAALANVKLCLVWALSLGITWDMAAGGVARAFAGEAADTDPAAACYADQDYRTLSQLPPQTVLAVSNLGAAILKNTGHRVLAGPYHRNVTGNLLAQQIYFAAPGEARKLLRDNEITLVVHCPGNSESALFAKWAPEGLLAALSDKSVPDWLEPAVDAGDGPLEIYLVRIGQ